MRQTSHGPVARGRVSLNDDGVSEGPTVVAIDDDLSMRRVLARVLAWRGFRPIVLSGREASVERILQHEPAAILVDYDIGALTAVQLADALAREEAPPPLILVSATGDRLGRQELERFAAIHVKPFRASALLDDVERLTRERRASARSGVRARSAALRRKVEGE